MTTGNLTIADNDTVIQYTASASQTVFPYDFPILDQSELAVSVDQVDKVLGTDFTVDGVGDAAGGNVTFASALTGGEKVTIWLDMPIKRLTGFSSGASTLLPSDLNTEFVRQIRQDQMLRRDIRRALRLAPDDPNSGQDMEIPTSTVRAGKYLAFDANGNPTVSAGSGGGDTSLRSDLANGAHGSTTGYNLVAIPITDDESTATITPANLEIQPRVLTRYSGITDDGVTDCTSAILTVCNAMGGVFELPPNVLYDRKTLLESLDTDVLIHDLSRINSYSSAGESTKRVGIIAQDEPVNDSAWNIDSGYHAVLVTNNFGTETTAGGSGVRGFGSWFWGRGHHTKGYALGNIQKRGDRYMGKAQFGNFDGDYWAWKLACIAPWVAQDYDHWFPTEPDIEIGDYRASSVGIYVASSAGTCGSTEPTHTSGTVSDGGVDWDYVDAFDRGLYAIDEYNRIRVGNPTSGYSLAFRVSPVDPDGNFSAAFEARGVSKNAQLRLVPTDSSGDLDPQPYFFAQSTVGLRVFDSTATAELARFTDSGFLLNIAHFGAETATNLADVGHAINTASKYAGRIVRDSTNNKLVMASGAAAADTWDNIADGSTEYSPA